MFLRNKIFRDGAVFAGIVLLLGLYAVSSYNALVRLNQQTQSQWAQVEKAYQRRLP